MINFAKSICYACATSFAALLTAFFLGSEPTDIIITISLIANIITFALLSVVISSKNQGKSDEKSE